MESDNRLNGVLLITRFVLATVVLAHGCQKLLGWFGGYGFEGTMNFFTGTIGLPYLLGILIIVIETAGMVALAMGIASRFFAASIMIVMVCAIVTVHASNGFFMNWFGGLSGEGYEYHLLAIALAVPTLIMGGGRYAASNFLDEKARFWLS